jgi:hypothetical protein
MMDHKEQLHLKELLHTHQRRLRVLELKQARQGINTPAELIMELEDLQNKISHYQSQLEALDRHKSPLDDQKPSLVSRHSTDAFQHIEIICKGDFDNLTPEIQRDLVRAIAAIVEISSDKVEILKVMRGSVIFHIRLPQKAAEVLMKIYNSNDKRIEDLAIEKIRVIPTSELDLSLGEEMSVEWGRNITGALKSKDRIVYRRSDGVWVNRRNDSETASSVHTTQRDAENAARQMLQKQGGGELTIKGADGRIRSKDSIKPSADPKPPKDKEH